jgi:hypothetical protein
MTSAADSQEKKSISQAFKSLWGKCRKPLVSVFVIYLAYCFWLMAWPTNDYFDAKGVLLHPVQKPLAYFGLYNSFKLFAPNPPGRNVSILFRVCFDDGTSRYWAFPRRRLMPFDSENSFDHYVYNYLFWRKNKLHFKVLADLARYIVRETDSGSQHPIEIDFIYRVTITPPAELGIGNPVPPPSQDLVFYSYAVSRRDLP